jgi:hypothetical protein
MSIMKGKLRRSAVVVAFSLGAFQALSFVGANVASAAVATCSFTGGVLTLGITGASVVSQDTAKNILVDGVKTDTIAGCTTSAAANVGNTTAINVTGPAGVSLSNESLTIVTDDRDFTAPTGTSISWGTINWTVNLGDNGVVPPGDTFTVDNSANTDDGVETDWGVSGVDLNGDGDLDVTLAGIETSVDLAGIGTTLLTGDTVNAGGTTATGAAYATAITIDGSVGLGDQVLTGGAGSDSITGGAGDDLLAGGLGNDSLVGGGGEDGVDYSASLTAVVVTLGPPGVGSGEGLDSLTTIEDVYGSSLADTITGDAGDNWIGPGAGDDTVDGGANAGFGDTYDVSDAEDGVTVDLGAGTSTGGSGTDTLTRIENVSGSELNDTLTGKSNDNILWGNGGNDLLSGGAGSQAAGVDDGTDSFDGGSGIDTIDYGLNTVATTVSLSTPTVPVACTQLTGNCSVTNGIAGELDEILTNSVENAILGTADDSFTGSAFNNIVWPNGGSNSLAGGDGIDTLNYGVGYEAGVTINLSGGGASGGGQDSIGGFENAVGTAFNDSIFGTDVVLGTNGANLLVGGKGNDTISANAGPDLVRGGAGNDRVRGGSGDDTLKGQGGKDNIRGGQGDDDIFGGKGKDFCVGGAGHDLIKTCERPRHNHQGPNGPGVASRLAAIKP